MPIYRKGIPIRRKVARAMPQVKPPGTRCYVPGYADDATQFAIDQSQLGISPLAVASTAQATGLKISLRKGAPRVFGGPLVSTVESFRSQIEGGSLDAIRRMDNARKTAKDKSAWQRIWNEMLPTWRIRTAQQYELIKQLDPSLQVMAPTVTPTAPGPTITPVAPAPPPPPGVTPPTMPTIGPTPVPIPAPTMVYLPAPPSTLPGGEPPIPVATLPPGTEGREIKAGLFGGDMGKLIIPGIGLLLLAQVFGKKRR